MLIVCLSDWDRKAHEISLLFCVKEFVPHTIISIGLTVCGIE